MNSDVYDAIFEQNPWLLTSTAPIVSGNTYINRNTMAALLNPTWDSLWTILIGPRQAGKTTLGKHLCDQLIQAKRYSTLLYLNCDYYPIRHWLSSTVFISDIKQTLKLENYILFIDEVQRVESPGLLLKIVADLKLPIKLIASGSSQLEIKSKLTEHLTGRQFETLILPLSCREIDFQNNYLSILQYGCYPQVFLTAEKRLLLRELYNGYIQKDIIEFLKIGKVDVIRKLMALLAHSSGQLLNYQQLATDCQVSSDTIKNYLAILEKTYVIDLITPYVGNKRTEITSNPVCYFIDNGFRNFALDNLTPIEHRTDNGLLVEGLVFQEIKKYVAEKYLDWKIHYWRTKGGAEVDFVIQTKFDTIIPIEVKYRNMNQPKISRSYRSFLEAYQPKIGIIITKNQLATLTVNQTRVHFIPVKQLPQLFEAINPDISCS